MSKWDNDLLVALSDEARRPPATADITIDDAPTDLPDPKRIEWVQIAQHLRQRGRSRREAMIEASRVVAQREYELPTKEVAMGEDKVQRAIAWIMKASDEQLTRLCALAADEKSTRPAEGKSAANGDPRQTLTAELVEMLAADPKISVRERLDRLAVEQPDLILDVVNRSAYGPFRLRLSEGAHPTTPDTGDGPRAQLTRMAKERAWNMGESYREAVLNIARAHPELVAAAQEQYS